MNEIAEQKKRILVLVDGFNLYHAIADSRQDGALAKCKWLDIKKLVEIFINKSKEEITQILYFTAYAQWSPAKVLRHKTYVSALRTAGIKPIISPFKLKDMTCRATCKEKYKTYEEKQTDVEIAINLFEGGIDDTYDKAIIVSADSDLIPAIEAVKRKFPMKEIQILAPPHRGVIELNNVADALSRIKKRHLILAQFPDEIILGEGKGKIVKPSEWC